MCRKVLQSVGSGHSLLLGTLLLKVPAAPTCRFWSLEPKKFLQALALFSQLLWDPVTQTEQSQGSQISAMAQPCTCLAPAPWLHTPDKGHIAARVPGTAHTVPRPSSGLRQAL